MSRDCTCQRWRRFSALVCLFMCLSSLHSLSLLLVHFKTPDKHKEWRDAFNDLFCRARNESEIRGVFHWHGPKCQQIGDSTQQQEERVRRHSVWCPILAIWQGRGWKKREDKRDGSRFSCYNPRRGARACFPVWKDAILYTHLSKFWLFLPAQSVNQRYWRCSVHS